MSHAMTNRREVAMRVVAAPRGRTASRFPILVLTACTLVVFFWVYLEKVVEPRLLLEDQLRALELVGTGDALPWARNSTSARVPLKPSPAPVGVAACGKWFRRRVAGTFPLTPDRNGTAPKAQRAAGRLRSPTNKDPDVHER